MTPVEIRNRKQLSLHVNSGNRVRYLFFWGHTEKPGEITKACLSQWYESPFRVDDTTYKTAEHYMMASKARLFNDMESCLKAISAPNPGAAKAIGRSVKNFNENKWVQHRTKIVVEANVLKFSQNPELKQFLIDTNELILVEASPHDRVWGIGISEDNKACENPNSWKGLNLLGFALMEVRNRIRTDRLKNNTGQ